MRIGRVRRPAFAVVSLTALLAACSPAAQPRGDAPAPAESAAPSVAQSPAASQSAAPRADATPQARVAGIDRLGLLTDPLPPPTVVATDTTDVPKLLAKAVKSGD